MSGGPPGPSPTTLEMTAMLHKSNDNAAKEQRRFFNSDATLDMVVWPRRTEVSAMSVKWEARPYQQYKWIVKDPELLGGRLAIRGSRISVALVLECLASGMTVKDINQEYLTHFSEDVISEVHAVAAEILGGPNVAA